MALEDKLFSIQAAALQVQHRRMDVIAGNIANADTPDYQARDIDFRKVLAATEASAGEPARTDPRHMDSAGRTADSRDYPLAYRVPLQPAEDGNTVDVQIEQAQYAEAAVRYRASLGFIDGRIKGLMTALTGQ